MKKRMFIPILFLLLILSACSSSASSSASKIGVTGAYISDVMAMESMGVTPKASDMNMPSMSGSNSAAYMLIKNSGDTPDKLLKVESDVAASAEIHQSELKADVMTMSLVDELDIPANGQVELKPGGYHIMLTGLKKELMVGSKVTLSLVFEKAGKISVDAEVKKP